MIIGSHVGMRAPKYLEGSVLEAISYGANALMVYTGAPQNTRRSPIEKLHVKQAQELMKENGIPMEHMIVHAPYLINLANAIKPEVSDLATKFLESEVQRTYEIGAKYIVVHPGSFTTTNLETGLNQVIKQLNTLKEIPDGIMILLETMAGKGSEVGRNFEELAAIIDRVSLKDKIGVCLDTCHISDGGYDLNHPEEVLDEFDRIIGLDKLKALHINDSLNPVGAHKDRHARIGEGYIGTETILKVINHPALVGLPCILETPHDSLDGYAEEIKMLRKGEI